jgi:predicted nucleic acid-binding protein
MPWAAATSETLLAFDTSVFSNWRRGRQDTKARILEYLALHEGVMPALTSMTVFEVLLGIEKETVRHPSKDVEQHRKNTQKLFDEIGTVLPFSDMAAELAAYLYARLGRSKQGRHWQDILITATALANGYGVATANAADFRMIGDLLPAGWEPLYLAIWKA